MSSKNLRYLIFGLFAAAVLGGVLWFAYDRDDPIGPTVNNAFVKFLEDNKYVIAPIPSNLESGGSLVYVKTTDGEKSIEWVGDLVTCGVPEDVVFGPGAAQRNNLFPSFNATGNNDLGATYSLKVLGLGTGANLGLARGFIIDVDDAGKEVVHRLAVASFITNPNTRSQLKPFCLDALDNQKTAVLVDVAYIEKGKVRVFRDDEFTTELDASELEELAGADGELKVGVDSDGTMNITERVYVGFKEAFYVPEEGALALNENVNLRPATDDLRAIMSAGDER